MSTLRRAALAGLVACVSAGFVAPVARAQDLPDATTIVARFHDAVGGVDRLRARSSIASTGEYAIPAAGIVARFESVMARPNRRAMAVEIPGFGTLRSGFTGAVAWSMNPAEGPRIRTGDEGREAADEADFNFQFRLPGGYASMTTVERASVGGQDCYRVRVAWASGRESFDCYAVDSGLLIASSLRQTTSAGTVDALYVYDDYRDFHGIRMPARVTVRVGAIEQVLTRSDVTFDAVPDSAFEPPAEITALIRG